MSSYTELKELKCPFSFLIKLSVSTTFIIVYNSLFPDTLHFAPRIPPLLVFSSLTSHSFSVFFLYFFSSWAYKIVECPEKWSLDSFSSLCKHCCGELILSHVFEYHPYPTDCKFAFLACVTLLNSGLLHSCQSDVYTWKTVLYVWYNMSDTKFLYQASAFISVQ